jgi:predicted ribosomally synthesized peptide with nif11-like leader
MSTEAVVTFFEKLETEEALAEEYAETTHRAMQDALRGAIVEFAAQRGFEFTAEDLDAHLEEAVKEMGDEDLEQVAGGGVEPSPFLGPPDPLKMPIDPLKRGLARFLRPRHKVGWDPGDIGR